MKKHDVLCVGLIVVDQVSAPIPKFPPPGTLVTTSSLELTIGGSAANVSGDLAKLSIPVAIVGRVGKDVFGEFVVNKLEQVGVNCDHVVRSKTNQTAATMVVNIDDEDRRFIHAVGANVELTGQEVTEESLANAEVLYVGGFTLNPALSSEHVTRLFQLAHKHNVNTVLDVVVANPKIAAGMVRDVLPYTDVFVPNRDEALMLTGESDPQRQAEIFIEQGAQEVVITSGERGACLLSAQGEELFRPAFQVEQIDGTGGGDAFVAGYIYGLLKRASVEECLRYGAALGASCVQAPGATTGVFNSEQLEQFLAEHE